MSFFSFFNQFAFVTAEYLIILSFFSFFIAIYCKYKGLYKEAVIFGFLTILSLLTRFSDPFIFNFRYVIQY